MPSYNKFPISDLRAYIWQEMKDSGLVSVNDYWVESFDAYLTPIIPAQQIPEFQNLLPGVPYVVYEIDTEAYDSDYWICSETATFTIVANGYEIVYAIMELFKDIFRRYDQSARSVNAFNPNSIFRFLQIYVDGMMSPEFGEEEGGVQVGTVRVSYQYTREIDESGRYST